MEREQLLEQIRAFLATDFEPHYRRTAWLLSLEDGDLREAAGLNGESGSNNAVLPSAHTPTAIFRHMLRGDLANRDRHIKKSASKLFHFVVQARARRRATGPLIYAEVREARIWKLRQEIRAAAARRAKLERKRSNEEKAIDRLEEERTARLLDILSVLDTAVSLDEAAIDEIESRMSAVHQEAYNTFFKITGYPRPTFDPSAKKNPPDDWVRP